MRRKECRARGGLGRRPPAPIGTLLTAPTPREGGAGQLGNPPQGARPVLSAEPACVMGSAEGCVEGVWRGVQWGVQRGVQWGV